MMVQELVDLLQEFEKIQEVQVFDGMTYLPISKVFLREDLILLDIS